MLLFSCCDIDIDIVRQDKSLGLVWLFIRNLIFTLFFSFSSTRLFRRDFLLRACLPLSSFRLASYFLQCLWLIVLFYILMFVDSFVDLFDGERGECLHIVIHTLFFFYFSSFSEFEIVFPEGLILFTFSSRFLP